MKSDWITIRVELLGRPGMDLTPPPGRVLLAHPAHTFGDLADAIDTAFGRWDLTPLHEFSLGPRRLLPGGDEDDPEAEDSDDVRLGDADLAPGTTFSYVFDLGEGWEHECSVDAGEDDGDIDHADGPMPIFGWGTIPDQYGRDAEGDEDDDPDEFDGLEADERADDDLRGADDGDLPGPLEWEIVARALPHLDGPTPNEELTAASGRLRAHVQVGQSPIDLLVSAADLDPAMLPESDEHVWLALAAAAVSPRNPGVVDAAAEQVWSTLEPADWAGAVVGLIRGDVGQSADAEVLVHLMAGNPDVVTEPLSDDDRDAVVEALDTVAGWWQALGAVDDDRRLTALGRWGLPRALREAWVS